MITYIVSVERIVSEALGVTCTCIPVCAYDEYVSSWCMSRHAKSSIPRKPSRLYLTVNYFLLVFNDAICFVEVPKVNALP